MNKKLKNIFIILCVVLGVAALGFGVFLLIGNNTKSDKQLMSESISKSIGSVKNVVSEEVSSLLEDKDATVKLTTDTKFFMNDGYDEQELSLSGDFYFSLKEIYANMKLSQGLDQELNFEALYKDNKFYHKIKDVYSRFYYMDAELNAELESNTSDIDYYVLFDYVSDVLTEQLEEKELTKEEDDTITLGGTEYTVNKLVAKFTEKDLAEIAKNLITKIKNDKDLYNSIIEAYESVNAELDSEEQVDIEEEINSLLAELDEVLAEADDKETLFKYTVYLDGEDVVSAVITLILDPEESSQNVNIGINTYENKDDNEVLEYYVSLMGIKFASVKFESVSDSETKLSAQVYQMIEVEGTIKETDNESKISLKAFMTVDEEVEILSLDMTATEVKEDKEYNLDLDFEFNYEEVEVSLTSENTVEVVDAIPEIDLSDAADISEMTEEERQFLEQFM